MKKILAAMLAISSLSLMTACGQKTEISVSASPVATEAAVSPSAPATPAPSPKQTGVSDEQITKETTKLQTTTKPKTTTNTTTTQTTPKATPRPTAKPTATLAPQMEVLGSSYNNEVVRGINACRADFGVTTQASLNSSMCAKALAHAKEMAKAGKRYHSSLGYTEMVSSAKIGGYGMGQDTCVHVSAFASDEITQIGVGAVRYNGKQYTCVIGI